MTPSEKIILDMYKEAGGDLKIATEKLEKEMQEEEQKHGGE
jgi:hypothetical protein